MVDIIKPFPYVSSTVPSNIYNQRPKLFCQPLNLRTNLSIRNKCSNIDRSNIFIQPKRWIGNCSNNPSRLLDVSNSPYSIHRKVMFQELSRHCPGKVDLTKSTKNKNQQVQSLSREPTKIIGPSATNIASQTPFCHGDAQNSRLFETLSKHVTIKPEPLRPSNSFVNSLTNTSTSWQKYWASTHSQRRRKEANEPEPILYQPKREHTLPGQTHFVVLRDSPHLHSVVNQNTSRTPSPSDSHTGTQSYISTLSDITTTKEKEQEEPKENTIKENLTRENTMKKDEPKKVTHTISNIEFVASSLIPSSIDLNSSAIASRVSIMNPVKILQKEGNKEFIDRSLLMSSMEFKSDSQLIEEVSHAQTQTRPIITKVYKLSLHDDKSKQIIPLLPSTRSKKVRSKSKDKKEARTSSPSKRKRKSSIHNKSTDKCDLPELMTATSKLRLSQLKWDEPYVGLRFDPPTPPCSPALFAWLKDSDGEDDDQPYNKSEIFEHKVTIKNGLN